MSPAFDPIAAGIQRCPFLHQLAAREGEGYARNIATNQALPGERGARQPIFQEMDDFTRVFRVFHGPEGVVPLVKKEERELELGREKRTAEQDGVGVEKSGGLLALREETRGRPRVAIAAPAASMSLSNFGFLGDFFNPDNNRGQRKPRNSGRNGQKGNGNGKGGPNAGSPSLGSGGTPGGGAGQCPLRRYFGPVATMVMSGKYKCPTAVVQMRSMLSKTPLVRALRPEGLPVKVLAVMAIASALNIPFGALREHCRKFSPEWFLVVHATIPFIAMFRKSVIMPKYAMAFTIAAAVGGQMLGARLERQRIQETSTKDNASECMKNARPKEALPPEEFYSHEHDHGGLFCAPQASLAGSGLKAVKHSGSSLVM